MNPSSNSSSSSSSSSKPSWFSWNKNPSAERQPPISKQHRSNSAPNIRDIQQATSNVASSAHAYSSQSSSHTLSPGEISDITKWSSNKADTKASRLRFQDQCKNILQGIEIEYDDAVSPLGKPPLTSPEYRYVKAGRMSEEFMEGSLEVGQAMNTSPRAGYNALLQEDKKVTVLGEPGTPTKKYSFMEFVKMRSPEAHKEMLAIRKELHFLAIQEDSKKAIKEHNKTSLEKIYYVL